MKRGYLLSWVLREHPQYYQLVLDTDQDSVQVADFFLEDTFWYDITTHCPEIVSTVFEEESIQRKE